MLKRSTLIIVWLATVAALFVNSSPAQVMGGGMQPPPTPERRPTELIDPDAVNGDRHDVDNDPFHKTPPRMSPDVSNLMRATLAAGGEKDWTTAKAKLAEARTVAHQTPFDMFEIEVVAAFVALNTGDHASALASYKKVIADPFFETAQTHAQQSAALKNAMILSNEASDFTSAIAFGGKLAAVGPIDDATAIALAVAYFGNGDYSTAKSLAQKCIDAATAAGIKPSEIATEIVAKSTASLH